MRQTDWYDPMKRPTDRVTIVGAGGIGSWTGLALTKLGVPNIKLIDFDVVESHNIPNQMYPIEAADRPKVEVLAEVCESFGGSSIEYSIDKITEEGWENGTGTLRGVVVAALDSMVARNNLWNQAICGNIHVPRLIDARLGGEKIVVYTVDPLNPEDKEFYEESLYTDEEATSDSCTAQSISDVGLAVASIITRNVRRHYNGDHIDKLIYLNQDSLNIYKEN